MVAVSGGHVNPCHPDNNSVAAKKEQCVDTVFCIDSVASHLTARWQTWQCTLPSNALMAYQI
ncbi:hypothetical protein XHC_1149 [Xanthomonas hortorum pv. carotae str. M081]|nr:hypothetical protein XHC_1149 [Xanthomonas hortorum pv. carotae str. M081]